MQNLLQMQLRNNQRQRENRFKELERNVTSFPAMYGLIPFTQLIPSNSIQNSQSLTPDAKFVILGNSQLESPWPFSIILMNTGLPGKRLS